MQREVKQENEFHYEPNSVLKIHQLVTLLNDFLYQLTVVLRRKMRLFDEKNQVIKDEAGMVHGEETNRLKSEEETASEESKANLKCIVEEPIQREIVIRQQENVKVERLRVSIEVEEQWT